MAVPIRDPDQRRRLQSDLFLGARRSHASWVCVGGPIAPGRTPCFIGEWCGRAGTSPPVALVAVIPVICGRTFHTCIRGGDILGDRVKSAVGVPGASGFGVCPSGTCA